MMSFKSLKPMVVFVLGGPGAGKGTQCELICKTFGYIHLSAGDLLRAERNTSGSEFGELIEHHIRNGTIVPVEITCNLIEKAMLSYISKASDSGSGDHISSSPKFLIDGFPRNKNNLDGWNKHMDNKTQLKFVLFFDCPREVCIERCLKRGQQGSGRSDDNIESMNKRLDTYNNDTMPIIAEYRKISDKMVKQIDASKSPQQVFDSVKRLFL